MAPVQPDLKLTRTSTMVGVAATLREAIVNGDLKMGMSLNEKNLCAMLDVSRTPLREALIELQNQSLVKIIPYRGAFVFEMDTEELHELGIYRAMLEKAALEAAFDGDVRVLCAKLSDYVEKMRHSISVNDTRSYGNIDTQYHDAIIGFSGNRFLIDGYDRVGLRLATLRNQKVQHDDETMRASFETHEAVVDMLRTGNKKNALARLDTHIRIGMEIFNNSMSLEATG